MKADNGVVVRFLLHIFSCLAMIVIRFSGAWSMSGSRREKSNKSGERRAATAMGVAVTTGHTSKVTDIDAQKPVDGTLVAQMTMIAGSMILQSSVW
jgi:hypothetical protein